MDDSVLPVEGILGYSFNDKGLLEEALTHSSHTCSASYQRLEFLGDSTLGLALTSHFFLVYPNLDPGQLSLLRAANLSTEKLARVAVRHDLYRHVRHKAAALGGKVKEFAAAVGEEEDAPVYGGAVKAPKVLADIVESLAAAVYVDLEFDLQKFWVKFRHMLEPIITPEDLLQQPQPVTMLFQLCQKQGKQLHIKHCRIGSKYIASVYIDGQFVASGSSKLNAAKGALDKLSDSKHVDWMDGAFEIEGAKQKLHEFCEQKKLPQPRYCTEIDDDPAHDKKYVCSVQIDIVDGVLHMMGDEMTGVRDAENSAASLMIHALQQSNLM